MFARSPLACGTVVARMGGRVVTREELLALFAAAERDPDRPYVDCLSIEEGFDLVLPARRDNHFGNHSCDPNTWHVDGFTLSARRDIEAGEELTLDYATQADGGFDMECGCGSAQCRRTVTGDDWRRADLQDRYGEHWVPVLLRRIKHANRDR